MSEPAVLAKRDDIRNQVLAFVQEKRDKGESLTEESDAEEQSTDALSADVSNRDSSNEEEIQPAIPDIAADDFFVADAPQKKALGVGVAEPQASGDQAKPTTKNKESLNSSAAEDENNKYRQGQHDELKDTSVCPGEERGTSALTRSQKKRLRRKSKDLKNDLVSSTTVQSNPSDANLGKAKAAVEPQAEAETAAEDIVQGAHTTTPVKTKRRRRSQQEPSAEAHSNGNTNKGGPEPSQEANAEGTGMEETDQVTEAPSRKKKKKYAS